MASSARLWRFGRYFHLLEMKRSNRTSKLRSTLRPLLPYFPVCVCVCVCVCGNGSSQIAKRKSVWAIETSNDASVHQGGDRQTDRQKLNCLLASTRSGIEATGIYNSPQPLSGDSRAQQVDREGTRGKTVTISNTKKRKTKTSDKYD